MSLSPFDLFKHALELTAFALVTLILFYFAPRYRAPCDCVNCNPLMGRGTWMLPPTPSGLDGPNTPLKKPTIYPNTSTIDVDPRSDEMTSTIRESPRLGTSVLSSSTSGSAAASTGYTTPPTQHRAEFPPLQVSLPRLSSPRIKTSPVISKEEFALIIETSPHARKFVHALAMKMVAERRRRSRDEY